MNNSDVKQKQIKALIIIFVIFCVGVISAAIIQQISRIGKVKLGIRYAPYIAEVEVNGKKVKNTGTIYLAPGEYEVKATLEGFDDLIQTQQVTKETENLYGLLVANSEAGQTIEQKYLNDIIEVQGLYGIAATKSGEEQRAKWPILKVLPINNPIFSIGYTQAQADQLQVNIDTTSAYLDSAINALKDASKSQSIILAEYDIIVKNLQNPFTNQFIQNNSENPLNFLRQGYNHIACTVHEGIRDNGYYYATITTGNEDTFDLVTYRVLLENYNNKWRLVSTPYPLLTTYNTPNVSAQTLEAVNNL